MTTLDALCRSIQIADLDNGNISATLWTIMRKLAIKHLGLNKIPVWKILKDVIEVPNLVPKLLSLLKTVEANLRKERVTTVLLLLEIVAHNDHFMLRNEDLTDLIVALPELCSHDQRKLLLSIYSPHQNSSTLSTEEILSMEPCHDNDFPNDFKAIHVFPSIKELNHIVAEGDIQIRPWSGDDSAIDSKHLDHQFRHLRADMLHGMLILSQC